MGALLKTDIVFARLLVMCMFLPQRLQVVAAIVASLYFVGRSVAMKMRQPAANYLWAAVLGSTLLLHAGAVLCTAAPYKPEASSLLERALSLLAFPLVFAMMGQYFRQLIAGQLRFFVYGCIIVCLVGDADFLYHYFVLDKGTEPMSHVYFRNIFESFTGVHPTYIGVYLAFAICITGIMWEPASRREAVFKYVMLCALLVFSLSLFAKSPILALGLIMVHFLYERRGQLLRFAVPGIALSAVTAAAVFFIPFVRQRAAEMLGLFRDSGQQNITQNSVHIRRLIWNTDMALAKHYWLTGIGPGRLLQALHCRYFFHSVYRGYPVGYFDPHSQYFYHFICFGIAGITVLMVTLFIHFRRALMAANHLYLYLLLIVAVTFFTETLLARQHGVLFYSIFTSLFFFIYRPSAPAGKQSIR